MKNKGEKKEKNNMRLVLVSLLAQIFYLLANNLYMVSVGCLLIFVFILIMLAKEKNMKSEGEK